MKKIVRKLFMAQTTGNDVVDMAIASNSGNMTTTLSAMNVVSQLSSSRR